MCAQSPWMMRRASSLSMTTGDRWAIKYCSVPTMPQPCFLIRPLRSLCHEIQFAQLILLFHCLYLLSSERKQNHLSITKESKMHFIICKYLLCFVLHLIFICFIEDNLKEVPGFLCLQRSSHSHASIRPCINWVHGAKGRIPLHRLFVPLNLCLYCVFAFFTALQCNESRC